MRVSLTADPSVEVERSRREGTDATAHRDRKQEKGHTLAIRTNPLENSSTSRRIDMDTLVSYCGEGGISIKKRASVTGVRRYASCAR